MSRNVVVIVTDCLRRSTPGTENGSPPLPEVTAMLGPRTSFVTLTASSSWTLPSHGVLLNGGRPWEYAIPWKTRTTKIARGSALGRAWQERSGRSVAITANPVLLSHPEVLGGCQIVPVGTGQPLVRFGFHYFSYLDRWNAHNSQASFGNGHEAAPSQERAGLGAEVSGYLATALKQEMGANLIMGPLNKLLKTNFERSPTFLFINMMEAHEPYPTRPGEERGGYQGSNYPTFNLGYRFSDGRVRTPDALRMLRIGYQEWAEALDHRLSEIISLLSRNGALSDALLVITGDHGQSLGEHGYAGHGRYLFDELTTVPCWILESADGKTNGPLSPEGLPRDHLDLYNLIQSYMDRGSIAGWESRDGPKVDAAEKLAVSYCDGGFHPAPVREKVAGYYQLLRTRANGAVVELRRALPQAVWEPAFRLGPTDAAEALLKVSTQLAQRVPWLPRAAQPGGNGVETRLRSWGY